MLPNIAPDLVGKVELCERLGWSRPRLDRRLQVDPRFPVAYRGGGGKGRAWAFDFDAVKIYLDGAETPPAGIETASLGTTTDAPVNGAPAPDDAELHPTEHAGERTARQRRDEAQAALLEDRLQQARGELVEANDLKDAVSIMLTRLAKGLDGLPETLIKRLGLPPERALAISEIVDNLRVAMLQDLRNLMSPP